MRRRLLLVFTFIMGAVGVWCLLPSGDTSDTESTEPVQADDVHVWIAYAPIQKGETVNLAKVRPAIIPHEEAQRLGVTASISMTEEENYVATRDVRSGDILSPQALCSFASEACQKLVISMDKTPYPLTVKSHSDIRTFIKPGDMIDIMLIATPEHSLAYREQLTGYQGLSAIPLLRQQTVLQTPSLRDEDDYNGKEVEQTIVLALTPENAAKVMVARRIGVLDIHKSTGKPLPEINLSEIVPDFSLVKELRGNKRVEQIPN
ncbi:RcpC/CpaB family pilus assembly protein [Sansalvadorimonas verongulae]|uniref:RcpC/CpaB family pilus assembly protein n=1 Tax=Sansalvadorimonas verongulae TaxID=2172824 RepID=UPI0012BB6607|nr:RcpC/CpaB family pilus assembly protein [Sansalvadorimonas verongulae]MTI15556.1 hypothetical protein [Sansalvadorimonas verongulae]